MQTFSDFDRKLALVSAAAFQSRKYPLNVVTAGQGARLLGDGTRIGNLSGFEARAWQVDGKVVIAFAGTNDWRDIPTNGLLGFGQTELQLIEAARFYKQIVRDCPSETGGGANVVFTGDSLGGRLPLARGMAATIEIHQGRRTVMEYMLSPVQRVSAEAGRER
jgi:hypothetical protein